MKIFLAYLALFAVCYHSVNSLPTDIKENGLGNPHNDYDGPATVSETMPGRHLTSQEIRNLIYIVGEDAKNRPAYVLPKNTKPAKEPRRKKRFIFRGRNAQNWILRRRERMRLRNERRRLRFENNIRRQQLNVQRLNTNTQRLNQQVRRPVFAIAPLPPLPLFPMSLFNNNQQQNYQAKPFLRPAVTSATSTTTTKAPTTTVATSTTQAPPDASAIVVDSKSPPVAFVQAPLPSASN